MSWKPLSNDDLKFASQLMKYIKTARGSNSYYWEQWLPSEADICKSALFERIRCGLEPLAEAPPLGYSCPWYALIEDIGPHFVYECYFNSDEGSVVILQNQYDIVETASDFFILKDALKHTSYRFKLYFDPKWEHPTAVLLGKGGWFIQNLAFEEKQ